MLPRRIGAGGMRSGPADKIMVLNRMAAQRVRLAGRLLYKQRVAPQSSRHLQLLEKQLKGLSEVQVWLEAVLNKTRSLVEEGGRILDANMKRGDYDLPSLSRDFTLIRKLGRQEEIVRMIGPQLQEVNAMIVLLNNKRNSIIDSIYRKIIKKLP